LTREYAIEKELARLTLMSLAIGRPDKS